MEAKENQQQSTPKVTSEMMYEDLIKVKRKLSISFGNVLMGLHL